MVGAVPNRKGEQPPSALRKLVKWKPALTENPTKVKPPPSCWHVRYSMAMLRETSDGPKPDFLRRGSHEETAPSLHVFT